MKLVYRDESHAYWLNGKRAKSASKVAGIAADSYTIEQWQKRQVAIGMTLDRSLAERVAVDLDNRETIQTVCDEAANTAKANARAQRGTQRHRVFELLLLGRQDQFVTDQQQTDAEILARTLDAYNLQPIPDRVEQFIAWPDNGVVGRYDAYLQHEGRPVLTDLKGGPNAVRYPHSTAVQLWLYRFAPHTSANIERDGDKTEVTEWTAAPEGADPESAYIIYCDDHHDVGELWSINLTAAARGGELALGIVDWRKAHNYGKHLAKQIAAPDVPSQTPVAQPAGEAPTPSPATPPSRRKRLLARYQAFNETERLAYCHLDVNRNDLDAVEAALNKVDTFNLVVPAAPHPTKQIAQPLEPPDEGGPVGETDIQELQARFDLLNIAGQTWTSRIIVEGKRSHDFRIKDRPTVRRYELYRGILALAEWSNGDIDDVIRAICHTIQRNANPGDPPGLLLGQLDADNAARFAQLAYDVTKDRYALTYEDTDTPRLFATA